MCVQYVGEWRLNAYMWVMLSIHNTRGWGSWVTLQLSTPLYKLLGIYWLMGQLGDVSFFVLCFPYPFRIINSEKESSCAQEIAWFAWVMCNLLWTQRILHINSKINHSLAWLCHPTLIIRWSSLTPQFSNSIATPHWHRCPPCSAFKKWVRVPEADAVVYYSHIV